MFDHDFDRIHPNPLMDIVICRILALPNNPSLNIRLMQHVILGNQAHGLSGSDITCSDQAFIIMPKIIL